MMENMEYPCKIGEVLYRIMDNCGGCIYETEVCQQRTCKHYRKYVEPMTVKSIDARPGSGEPLYYITGEENSTDALFGWTAFKTEKEAWEHLENFN